MTWLDWIAAGSVVVIIALPAIAWALAIAFGDKPDRRK